MKLLSKSSPINHVLVLIGLAFFANPNYMVIDILPDFIGALLVVLGTYKLAEIDSRAAQARKSLLILALVNTAKWLTLFFPHDNGSGQVWMLVFTLCFGLGEGILFAYGMAKLFEGIGYQGMRLDCTPVYGGFTALTGLTVLISILKNLLVMLPELTRLTGQQGDVTAGAADRAAVAEFLYTILTVVNLLVVTAYGIGWWLYMLRYFKTVGKEKNFLARLDEHYRDEVADKHEILTYRSLKIATTLFILALLLLAPLRLSGTDVLPDFAAALLFGAGIVFLYDLYPKVCKKALVFCGMYFLTALAEWCYILWFYNSVTVNPEVDFYDAMATVLLHYPEKLPFFFVMVGLGILNCIAWALFLFFFVKIFPPMIAEHTGSMYEGRNGTGSQKGEAVRRGLGRWIRTLSVLSFVTPATGAVYRAFRLLSGSKLIEYTEWIGVLILFAVFAVFLYKLQTAIDDKYYMAE